LTVAASTTVLPRPVFCVIEDEHRDRAVADAARAGRFEYFDTALELGTEPDWTGADLPPDDEWRIAWSKFYEGLDLAHAFAETGERAYLEAWERLVSSWLRRVPVGWDTTDVAARRVQNWLYAWQAFTAAPSFTGLSPGLDEHLIRSIDEQAAHIRANLSPARNHRTLELYTLFLVPLALPQTDPSGELLAEAMGLLHENLLADVLPDGVHCERSTHYHLLVLRSFLGARENARRFGLRFPDGFDERLRLACDFAVHCHRPEGRIPALSDSDSGSYLDLLDLGASLLGPPGRRLHADFPDGGYFFQRSGWGDAERFLCFDCGPIGNTGHGHYDLLSIELSANGRPLLVDPGRFTYDEAGSTNWRHWFKGTAAHNTVCVDGLDQVPYRLGKPKGPTAEACFLGRTTLPGMDVLHGGARSPCYDAVHSRRIFFLDNDYWLIEDRLRGETAHRYDLRFHLAPQAWGATEIGASTVRGPGVELAFVGGHEPVLEEGWYSPEYGVKLRAPVVSVVVEGVRDATFVTRVTPLGRES
jgi:Heparinase II/III-like protein/Heparinase II/III N-terminus